MDDGGFFIFLGSICLVVVILVAVVIHCDSQTAQRFTDICHAHGWKSAYETETQGKTSTTYRFCVDENHVVRWIGDAQ